MTAYTFGKYLNKLRLERGMGLRVFADLIHMAPSNLSDIERSKKSPPRDPAKLAEIAKALRVENGTEEWNTLHDLSVQDAPERIAPDLVSAKKSEMIPLLLRTAIQKKLSREELEKLIETIKKEF